FIEQAQGQFISLITYLSRILLNIAPGIFINGGMIIQCPRNRGGRTTKPASYILNSNRTVGFIDHDRLALFLFSQASTTSRLCALHVTLFVTPPFRPTRTPYCISWYPATSWASGLILS